MNTSFLNALKNKATQIQTEREAAEQKKTPVAHTTKEISDWLDPTGKLQSAGLMKAKEEPVAAATIEIVENRNRLDVTFDRKPSEKVLEALRSQGFHYRPSDRAWYHQDNNENREFLSKQFEVQLEPKTEIPVVIPAPIADPEIESEGSPEYKIFKQQVNELLGYLNIDAADLMLKAMDCLHKQTFGRN